MTARRPIMYLCPARRRLPSRAIIWTATGAHAAASYWSIADAEHERHAAEAAGGNALRPLPGTGPEVGPGAQSGSGREGSRAAAEEGEEEAQAHLIPARPSGRFSRTSVITS